MEADKVGKKSRSQLGALGSFAGVYLSYSAVQVLGRDLAVLLEQRFNPGSLSFRNQSILELLRIDRGRILRQEWDRFVRGYDVLDYVLLLQQLHPGIQQPALCLAFR